MKPKFRVGESVLIDSLQHQGRICERLMGTITDIVFLLGEYEGQIRYEINGGAWYKARYLELVQVTRLE